MNPLVLEYRLGGGVGVGAIIDRDVVHAPVGQLANVLLLVPEDTGLPTAVGCCTQTEPAARAGSGAAPG